ncbi:MAG: hypothetical protein HOP03_01655 [Lysobacter sp.]|nr:hypothetical protein [Lysobacter sp.]
MTRLEQSERELEVFRSFVRICPLEIDDGSIESRSPPQPDIHCVSRSGKEMAFEITRLIDQQTLRRIDIQELTKGALRQFYLGLPSDEKCRFDERYHYAFISFDFSPGSSMDQRRKIFRSAFDILLSCRQYLSEFVIRFDPDLMPTLHTIRVKKTTLDGPSFYVSGFGYLTDPTRYAISAKFGKSYEANCQIELLAYVDWDLLPDEQEFKLAAREVCNNIDESAFRRVWIYNLVKNEIVFVFPELQGGTRCADG